MAAMTPPASADELDQAIGLVRGAARLAADAFHASTREVHHKPDGSVATPTDLAVEDHLREHLRRHHPHDGVTGEERPPHTGTSGRRWIIDPISGTHDFLHRVPLYSVDLALEDAHGPAIAVTALPASDLVTAAGRGLGAWLLTGDQRLPASPAAVSTRTDLAGAVVCVHGLAAWPTTLITALHRQCRPRDGVHSVQRLLTGRADAILATGLAYEDLACLPLLVDQAGGRVTDTTGRPVLSGDGTVLVTNGHLHDQFLALIGDNR